MPGIESQETTCRKLGFVLTCYVDGKKRFRAVRAASGEPIQPTRTPPSHDEADPSRLRPSL